MESMDKPVAKMGELAVVERRRGERTPVSRDVDINGVDTRLAGKLRDISAVGASVALSSGPVSAENPLNPGEQVELIFAGVTMMASRVARVFEGGYAVEFEWDIDISGAF